MRPAACAAKARCPASSTAATTTRVAFAVDERELRHALAARGAVVELQLGGDATPAVLKDAQRHPVRGHTMHVDFLRVNLNVAIHAVVTLELLGGEDAPGTSTRAACSSTSPARSTSRRCRTTSPSA